ncbi:terminase small subunit, partial [Escherichia coli]|nr:terminase small subunit [Escherichia coli]
TIQNWQEQGMPVLRGGGKGNEVLYDSAAVIKWYAETMPQASSVVSITLIGGAGFNVGSPQQAGISELVLRAGNGNPKGITGA